MGDRAIRAVAVEPWTGTSPLRGPLLALLLRQEHPISAYKVSTLLRQRLPVWEVTPSSVSHLLKRLVSEGLVSRTGTPTAYSATVKARVAVEEWMRQPLEHAIEREELHARIVSSSAHHALMLIGLLDDFELESFAAIRNGEDLDLTRGSWSSLTIDIARSAADKALHAKIDWSREARARIMKWVENERQRASGTQEE